MKLFVKEISFLYILIQYLISCFFTINLKGEFTKNKKAIMLIIIKKTAKTLHKIQRMRGIIKKN